MAKQQTSPGIEALQKAGYSPQQISEFAQFYTGRANAMGAGKEVPKVYLPTQDDNASIIQEFTRSITNATAPVIAKGLILSPKILANKVPMVSLDALLT